MLISGLISKGSKMPGSESLLRHQESIFFSNLQRLLLAAFPLAGNPDRPPADFRRTFKKLIGLDRQF
jgi:hypothetical protein